MSAPPCEARREEACRAIQDAAGAGGLKGDVGGRVWLGEELAGPGALER